MKTRFVYFLVIIILVLISGCSQKYLQSNTQANQSTAPVQNSPDQYEQQPPNLEPETQKQENTYQQADPEKASIEWQFKELERIMNALIQDNLIVGMDRYESMENQLKELEQQGIATEQIQALREKLLTLKPEGEKTTTGPEDAQSTAEQEFNTLKQEIEEIITSGSLVGPEHYARMANDLNELETHGINSQKINELKTKLEQLNPTQYENTVNTTGAQSAGSNMRTQIEIELLNQLPDCTEKQYTHPIVDLTELMEISRLGSIGPPGHTFPTEHMYYHIYAGRTTTNTVPLKAPAEIYIYGISAGFDDLGKIPEYTISFALCRDILGYFNHVKGISRALMNANDTAACRYPGETLSNCDKDLFYKASAGEEIGRVGHLQGNFDFGTMDYRIKNAFANPVRYGQDNSGIIRPRSLYIVCPLEYYENSAKNQLYAKVTGIGEPKCGQVMQDIPGTLQGNWFNGEDTFSYNYWEKHLAFVNDNADPSKNVVSVGGTFKEASEWIFTPQNNGTINRKFSEVQANGNMHCYDQGGNGKILVQMVSDTELKIEYVQGTCTGTETFSNPTTYNR